MRVEPAQVRSSGLAATSQRDAEARPSRYVEDWPVDQPCRPRPRVLRAQRRQ